MPKRYFDESGTTKPGSISEDLRKALKLRRNELPIWIYRMRVLGYPPGWLKKAHISRNTISTFEGYDVNPELQQTEDGVYNPELLVEFPGFNIPAKEFIDDCELLGMPPMMQHQLLKVAKRTIKTPKPVPYKRIKLGPTSSAVKQEGESSSQKIETESSVMKEKGESSQEEEGESSSPENSDNSQSHEISKSQESISKETLESSVNVEGHELLESGGNKEELLNSSQTSDTSVSGRGELKLISVGSPVPSSLNAKKPPLENWGVGMGELIHFENLPTSTGAFDKMRNILHKVRDKLTSL